MRRFHLGTVTLREIRELQKSMDLLTRKVPFHRLVREVANNIMPDVHFQAGTILQLWHASEALLVEFFAEAQLVAVHANRNTILLKDLHLAVRMIGVDKTNCSFRRCMK